MEELLSFSAAQLGLDAGLIELYRKRQPTISEHQQTFTGYMRLRAFDDAEAAQLEQSSSRSPVVWNRRPRLWAGRGSFLKSNVCSSPLSSGLSAL
ncbi:MAG: DUF4158 domain-containing protein [Verrucomicrobia bacterium]|nr:DUF4158 domain-containing protein [Verrucomicrobiota bacterium]